MPTGQLADGKTPLGLLEREFDSVCTEMMQAVLPLDTVAPESARTLRASLQSLMSVFVQIVSKVCVPKKQEEEEEEEEDVKKKKRERERERT